MALLPGRQSVTPLHSASLKRVLPVSGAHTDPKSVCLELMAVIGLVSSLHKKSSWPGI